MGQFQDWVVRKRPRFAESIGGMEDGRDAADKFRFNAGHDVGGDYDKDLRELAKVVMSKYKNEFTRFLNQIADERNDGEIRSLLKRIDSEQRSPDPWLPSHPKDKDEVVPPNADRGAEMGAGSQ